MSDVCLFDFIFMAQCVKARVVSAFVFRDDD